MCDDAGTFACDDSPADFDIMVKEGTLSAAVHSLKIGNAQNMVKAFSVAATVRVEYDAQAALGSCDSRKNARTRCAKVVALAAELANAEARESEISKLDSLRRDLYDLPAPKVADPQAAAVAGALNAALSLFQSAAAVSEASAKLGLALLLVALLELGPITCARAAVASHALPQPPRQLIPGAAATPVATQRRMCFCSNGRACHGAAGYMIPLHGRKAAQRAAKQAGAGRDSSDTTATRKGFSRLSNFG